MSPAIRPLTGDGSPPVEGSYPQAVETTGATRWLHLSGQIPVADMKRLYRWDAPGPRPADHPSLSDLDL